MNAVVIHSICSVMSISAILLAVSNRRDLSVNCGRIKTNAMQNGVSVTMGIHCLILDSKAAGYNV
jgi:hypothetical protein